MRRHQGSQIVLYPDNEGFKLDAVTEVMPLSKFLAEIGT
jgi:hypothetical protein